MVKSFMVKWRTPVNTINFSTLEKGGESKLAVNTCLKFQNFSTLEKGGNQNGLDLSEGGDAILARWKKGQNNSGGICLVI